VRVTAKPGLPENGFPCLIYILLNLVIIIASIRDVPQFLAISPSQTACTAHFNHKRSQQGISIPWESRQIIAGWICVIQNDFTQKY